MEDEIPFNQWDKTKHQVVDVPIVHWLRHEYPDRELLVYYHLKHKTFTIFEWKNKARGWFHEYLVIGKSPGDFDREKGLLLKEILYYSPEEERRRLRDYVQTTAAYTRQGDIDGAEEHRDSYKFVRKRGKRKIMRDHPKVVAFAEA